MPVPRTDAQMLGQLPIKLFFGEQTYDVKVLTVIKNREWKEKLAVKFGVIIGQLDAPAEISNFLGGLTMALIQMPDKLAEMVFEYAPDLPKEDILKIATDEQICLAFSEIMQVAYPFLAQLGTMRQVAKSEKWQQMANSTKYVS